MAKVTADLTNDVVALNLTADSLAFVNMLIENGTQGDSLNKNLDVNQSIRDLVDAIYQVFAGGTPIVVRDAVTNLVTSINFNPAGDLGTFQQFKLMEQSCTNAINKINSTAKYKHVIEF
jgi:hypothetical protein